jgi:hypothetical protein
MSGYSDMKLYQKDFKPYELLEFHTRLLSKIVQRQRCTKKELLPIDIKKDPLGVLGAVGHFVEHRIQMTEIKGVCEFLGGGKKDRHNRVGKE